MYRKGLASHPSPRLSVSGIENVSQEGATGIVREASKLFEEIAQVYKMISKVENFFTDLLSLWSQDLHLII